MTERIAVAGGGYAGALAAVRAAKLGKKNVEVHLINDQDVFIERIRLHEEAVHGRIIRWPLEDLLRGTNVRLHRCMVISIDPNRRVVCTDRGEMAYDKLVFALGSATDRSRLPEGAKEFALVLAESTTSEIRRRLQSAQCRSVVVCGGGLVGVELATEIAEAHPEIGVTLVTEGEVARALAPRARERLRNLLAQAKVELREHARVERIAAGQVWAGAAIPCDLCVMAPGMQASPVAGRSGLPTNAQGQILVDHWLRALEHPDIYVAGDAAWAVPAPGSRLAMGCKYGMPMAAQAASNLVASLRGRPEEPFDFEDTHFAVSIGRRNGLVQLNKPDAVLTGRTAARIKEIINRSALWSIRWERSGWFNYPYVRTGRIADGVVVSGARTGPSHV